MFFWPGRNAPKPCAALSEEDVRHIQNLDYLVKAWYKWRDMLVLQAKVVQHEADLNAIDLRKFRLPPYPWVSDGLREWMYDFADLKRQAKELQRLKDLREGLLREVLDAKRQKAPWTRSSLLHDPPTKQLSCSGGDEESLVSREGRRSQCRSCRCLPWALPELDWAPQRRAVYKPWRSMPRSLPGSQQP